MINWADVERTRAASPRLFSLRAKFFSLREQQANKCQCSLHHSACPTSIQGEVVLLPDSKQLTFIISCWTSTQRR
jgi:hypothetical protein